MFQKLITKLVKAVTPKCPMDGYAGSIEFLQFKNWRRELTMETPRGCLEFLNIREYVCDKGMPLGDKTRWISGEEKAKILAHHHTTVFPTPK